jgi:predicted MarR family transcription regulator
MTTDRPRGGRRPEDFPEARARDEKIIDLLRTYGGMTRNDLATNLYLDDRPKLVTYALHRLRLRGLVHHTPKGNEGHGAWAVTAKARQERGA